MKRLLTIFIALLVLQSCGYEESDDRDECAPAFKRLVGFTPPSSIKEIRHGYFVFRDGVVDWMEFTYDKEVMELLFKHDTALRIATSDTEAHNAILKRYEKENPNAPSWFIPPDRNTSPIYHKEDFLDHTFSEYYLWIDHEAKKVVLHIHYFD
jgi:hypothetical protein